MSDIGLPDGNGRDLMRELCTRRPVRGIALTGFGTDQDLRLDSDAGFAAHLTKPVDPEQLLATLRDFARHPPRRDDARSRSAARSRDTGNRSG